MKRVSSVGLLLLGVWLILVGISGPPINLSFNGMQLLTSLLAIVTGVLILAGR
jgi:hypothetical protein